MTESYLFKTDDDTLYYTGQESLLDFDDESINPDNINDNERMIRWRDSAHDISTEVVEKVKSNEFLKYDHIYIINSIKAGKSSNYDLRLKNEFASLYYNVLKRYVSNTSIHKTDTSSAVYDIGVKIKEEWKEANGNSQMLAIVLSGDTSLSELLNGSTLEPNLDILTVPLGTANALFLKLFNLPRDLNLSENVKQEQQQILKEIFFKFLKSDLELFKVPFYTVANKEGKELTKSILLTTTGFHSTLLKVASSPEYKKYGVERFVKASGDVINNYKLDNLVKLYNEDGKIYYEGESSYFGIFCTGRLEPKYDISPKSTLKNRAFLSIRENGDRDAFVGKIMSGYSEEKILLETFDNDQDVAYQSIDIHETLYLQVTSKNVSDAKRDVSICVDGYILDNELIKNNVPGTYTVKIKAEPVCNVSFYSCEKGLFSQYLG